MKWPTDNATTTLPRCWITGRAAVIIIESAMKRKPARVWWPLVWYRQWLEVAE
jgi:hypothetical protein